MLDTKPASSVPVWLKDHMRLRMNGAIDSLFERTIHTRKVTARDQLARRVRESQRRYLVLSDNTDKPLCNSKVLMRILSKNS